MMEYETSSLSVWSETTPRTWSCIVTVDSCQIFTGGGPTEEAAIIDALDRAAGESTEARAELGIMLKQRGGGKGGRPLGG